MSDCIKSKGLCFILVLALIAGMIPLLESPVYAAGESVVIPNASERNLTMGANQSVFIAPNIELNNFGVQVSSAKLVIENLPSDATPSYTGVGGLTVSYDSSKNVYTITGTASASDYQTLFRSFKISSGSTLRSDIKFNFLISVNATTPMYYSGTGHYYEYIAKTGAIITWTDAAAAASGRSYNGMEGYLATIMSEGENTFVVNKMSGSGWIGASDAAANGTWQWSTGPESGTQFWQGYRPGAGSSVGGYYNNWYSGEPNKDTTLGNYAHIFVNSPGWEAFRSYWNDMPNSHDFIQGYVVEYGGMPGDAPADFAETVTVNISVIAPDAPVATAASSITATAFSANWNSVSAATGYRLDVATDSSFTSLVTGYNNLAVGNVTTYSVSGLSNATPYYYRVRGTNSAGSGSSSNTITATTLSSDAGLTSVLSQGVTAGGEAGTSGAPKTAAISVAYGVSTVAAADIVKHQASATATFYGTDQAFTTTEAGSVPLTAGSGTIVYIKVAAQDGTTLHYKVTINRSAPPSSDAGLSSVLSQAVTAGAEAGTVGAPKTATVSVANGVSTVAAADVVKHDAGATMTFYGADGAYTTQEGGSIALTAGAGTAVYIKVAAADSTTLHYKVTINRAAPPSSDAGLSSVLGQSITAGAEAGTSGAPKTAAISVANGTSAVVAADVVKHHTGAAVSFYGTDSTFTTAAVGNVGLTAGAGTAVYIKITAEDSTTLHYVVTINRASAPAASSGGGTATSVAPAAPQPVAAVNGQQTVAGVLTTSAEGGSTSARINIDPASLSGQLSGAGAGSVVTIPFGGGADVTVGELNGQMVREMESAEAVLVIQTPSVQYTLPAQQINIDAVSSALGADVALADIKVSVEIAKSSEATVKLVQEAADDRNLTLVVPAVDFNVSCTYGGRTVSVERFNAYVERRIAVPAGVDPSRITTGIVVEANGETRHVPTRIVEQDGVYYAVISALTNSTYSVVWNPVSMPDVEQHWAKLSVNNMASRMIISGVESGNFEPDREITRAEAAAIVVRALGLKSMGGQNPFNDVPVGAWYKDAVITAASNGLISGYADGTFAPDALITREQAMAIIARAMKITALQGKAAGLEDSAVLARFTDSEAIADYAVDGIAQCVQAGIVSGRTETCFAPKANITRAEAAVAVERLLRKSGLIN